MGEKHREPRILEQVAYLGNHYQPISYEEYMRLGGMPALAGKKSSGGNMGVRRISRIPPGTIRQAHTSIPTSWFNQPSLMSTRLVDYAVLVTPIWAWEFQAGRELDEKPDTSSWCGSPILGRRRCRADGRRSGRPFPFARPYSGIRNILRKCLRYKGTWPTRRRKGVRNRQSPTPFTREMRRCIGR